MKTTVKVPLKRGAATNRSDHSSRLEQLESLVDELIKESPQEARIRNYMKAVGLPYSEDPIERMNRVLAALDGAQAKGTNKGGGHGRSL